MVNDWKTGIKPKGNCILFKWVGVWVNQVQVKKVLLTVHLFLLFLGFLFKTFAIMCSTNWLKQCFNVSRWVAPKYENVETMPETVNFNDHAYTSVFYNTILHNNRLMNLVLHFTSWPWRNTLWLNLSIVLLKFSNLIGSLHNIHAFIIT